MNYLEVKLEEKKKEDITSDFIQEVIKQQETLSKNIRTNDFDKEALLSLGFIYNATTDGYYLQKKFKLEELIFLTKSINSLPKHILTHGYINLKYHENELYFWDTALIYEGVDTFDYCLKYHNIIKIKELKVVTNSDYVSEDILKLVGLERRYSQPSIEYITQECLWDKKNAYKIAKNLVSNIDEYIYNEEIKQV